ncbi:MAG: hypothetical protein AAGI69_12710 [Cyanobacteria bacterium P01_H01_bin.21]
MAVLITTNKPRALLKALKKKIDDGKIDTWEYDADGDFTHVPDQWKGKGWLRPKPQQGLLAFGLLGQKGVTMKKQIYGLYHGRFIDMMLTHFDDQFSIAQATAIGTDIDNFETK